MPRLPSVADFDRPVARPNRGIVAIDRGPFNAQANAEVKIGLAKGELGEAFWNVSKEIDRILKMHNDARAEAAVNQAKESAQELEIGEGGFGGLKGENAARKDVLPDYTGRFEDRMSTISGGLQNDEQRSIFSRRIAPLRSIYGGRLVSHVGREVERYEDDVFKHSIELETRQAVENWDVPDALAASQARINFTLNQKAERSGWSPERVQDTRSQLMSGIHLGVVDRLLANRQDQQAQGYYDRVRGEINPEIATKIERGLTGAREAREAQDAAALREVNARATSDLEIAVRRGAAGYRDIEAAYGAGVLTPGKRTELTGHLDTENRKATEKAQKEREQLERVQLTLDGRGFLDFRSDRDRDAVDSYYGKAVVPVLSRPQFDPNQRTQAMVDFAARVGVVPSPVKQTIRGALRAGDPEAKVGAADLLDRLKTASPQLINDFSDEDIRLGTTISTYVRSGVPAASAVSLAEKNLAVTDAERKARDARYSQEKVGKRNVDVLKKELTGFRWFEPSMPAKVPDALAGEFEELVRQEFVRSGEIEPAQQTALDYLRRVWGVTRTGPGAKPAWMRYAPEALYRVPGEDPAWIREQLNADFTRNPAWGPAPQLSLAADSLTAREERPSYQVLRLKPDGVMEPVIGGDGKTVRFRPDYPNSPAGGRRREAMQRERSNAARILGPRGSEATSSQEAGFGFGGVAIP